MNVLMKIGLAALTAAVAFAEDEPDLGPPPVGFVWARYIGGEDHTLFPNFTTVGSIVAVHRRVKGSLLYEDNDHGWGYKDAWLDFVYGRPEDV